MGPHPPSFVVAATLLSACAADDIGVPAEATAGSTMGSTTDGGTSGMELPSECDATASPFLSAQCLGALRLGCQARQSESDCTAAEPMVFDEGGFIIECGWATVVTFGDSQSCQVVSAQARCEAILTNSLVGCGDPCDLAEPGLHSSWMANDLELINLCFGPLGPWSAVGAAPDPNRGLCAANTIPEAPPLCACAQLACDASP